MTNENLNRPENDLSFYHTTNVFTYKKLDIDLMPATLEVIQKAYPFPENPEGVLFSYFAHYKFSTRHLNPEFNKLLNDCNLYARHAEVFHRPGTGELMDAFIHVDGHEVVPELAKINYIIGGEGNIMQWWRPKGPVTEENKLTTKAQTQYLAFEEHECDLIDEIEMTDGLYVVNAGIPHSVIMRRGDAARPRICISIVPRSIEKDAPSNAGCWDVYQRLSEGISKLASKNS